MTLHAEAGSDDVTPLGVVLGERYELRSLLGEGGSGAVYLAHDRLLQRPVAVKMLRSVQDELASARLRAEARIAGALSHPGVARLLEVAEEDGPAGPAPYLVMEYVDGQTLRDVLRSGDRLTVETVLRLIGQVADALAAVHAAGIVHRDLKPANIMLAREGRVVLLDFGIARHRDVEPLTLTGTIVGTVDYISPEQAAGSSATPASDLYALGTLAYECLTGLRPLSRDTQVSTLMAHALTPVPPLPPTYPDGVRDLIASMVALDPAHRPPSAAAVADRARELLGQPQRRVVGARPTAARPVPPADRTILGDIRRRHLLAAACALVLAAATGAVLMERGQAPVAAATGGVVTPALGGVTPSPGPSAPARASSVADPVDVAPPAVAQHRAAKPKPVPAPPHHRGRGHAKHAVKAAGKAHGKGPHGHGKG